jgi:hypothetical protein
MKPVKLICVGGATFAPSKDERRVYSHNSYKRGRLILQRLHENLWAFSLQARDPWCGLRPMMARQPGAAQGRDRDRGVGPLVTDNYD